MMITDYVMVTWVKSWTENGHTSPGGRVGGFVT